MNEARPTSPESPVHNAPRDGETTGRRPCPEKSAEKDAGRMQQPPADRMLRPGQNR